MCVLSLVVRSAETNPSKQNNALRRVEAKILQCETEISFRFIPSLTRSHTKPRTKHLRGEGFLVKKDVSLKDNSVSHCIINYEVYLTSFIYLYVLYIIMINSLISKLNFV